MSSIEGFTTAGVVSGDGRLAAEFVPDANMLCHSLTYDGVQLLDGGRGVAAYAQRGKTMGIPLLYPWANRLAQPGYTAAGRTVTLPPPDGRYGTDPNGLPIHGALPGLMRWELDERAAPDRLRARLRWQQPALRELFPFAHELALEIRAGEAELELITTARAGADDPLPVSFGYHPYLAPGEVPREQWEVELGAGERLAADARMIPTGQRTPLSPRAFRLADASWDDGLAAVQPGARFAVTAGARTLALSFEQGYGFAQVYAPPGKPFICFEPMTAPTNALGDGRGLTVLDPGGEYRAAFRIAVG